MNPMEKAALQHVAEELTYRRSTQARRDAIADRQALRMAIRIGESPCEVIATPVR